jgi:acyl-coenzyme A thioesterase PaaI-like protein
MERALQDIAPVHCYGCGSLNPHGLQIKSFWAGDEVVCAWRAQPHHIGYPGILYGGILAAIVDCHALWTATAFAYRAAGVEFGGAEGGFGFVTASLKVDYRRPVPVDRPLELRARVTESTGKKSFVACTVICDGATSAEAEVLAVRARMPASPKP